jgi:serine/threonine-protein kinase
MLRPMGCVDENTVLALLHDGMESHARAVVNAHVDGCEACRLLIAELARQTPAVASGMRTLPLGGGLHPMVVAATLPADSGITHTASPALVPGTVIADRYRLDYPLGEGGTGVVWAATHMLMGRPIALKLLKATEPDDVRRFLREARLTAMLHHPNIVEVHDLLELPGGGCAMVMELLNGESLRTRFRRERTLSLPEAARLLLPIASALAAVHAQGIIHRDLKPENVFLQAHPDRDSREPPTVKVLDFGLAKSLEGGTGTTSKLTRTGALLGTPYYMSPEQVFAEKDIDARADLWALGVMLYEALAGVRPIEGTSFGQIFRVITTGTIRPLEQLVPGLPPPIAALVAGLLQRDRRARLADLGTVLGVLRAFAGPPS